jgi:Domain of unknown function in PX-proteins (DUF3818)
MVLSYDSSEFRNFADKIEKAKGGPSKEHLAAIKQHIDKPRIEHDKTRSASIECPTSMIATILEDSNPDLLSSLSETQHAQCLQYYSALLEIRDREEITKILCRQSPDLFTQAIRDVVASFEPMIRLIHERVDLREQLSAAEGFLADFISTSKAKKAPSEASETRAPTIEDYTSLLKRGREPLYGWFRQFSARCPEIRDEFRTWAKNTIKVFRHREQASSSPPSSTTTLADKIGDLEGDTASNNTQPRKGAAGALSGHLQSRFTALPLETRGHVLAAVDAHAKYLSDLEELSLNRMQRILDNIHGDGQGDSTSQGTSTSSICGPGIFLSRWQQLLDETRITPEVQGGPIRYGKDIKHTNAQFKTGNPSGKDGWDPATLARLAEKDIPSPPSVDIVVETLGQPFRELANDFLKDKAEEILN